MYTLKQLQKIIEEETTRQIGQFVNLQPTGLYEPVGYTLGMGGKRLRPVMVLLAFNMFSDKLCEALPAAMAVETFHNFTLLHDDIMDKAKLRRNMETVHVRYNQNKAILSGDVMSFLAYRFLLQSKSENLGQLLDLFTKTAVEVCEGQQLDMDFESREDVTEQEYIDMIGLKTGVLMGCSLKTGALLGNSVPKIADQLYEYGFNLGLAFQLQDDLLDTFGEENVFGKKIGGDIVSNKKTYLLIKALEIADNDQKNKLLEWLHKPEFNSEEKITSVKSVFNKLQVNELAKNKINDYFGKTLRILEKIELTGRQKKQLEDLNRVMIHRNN